MPRIFFAKNMSKKCSSSEIFPALKFLFSTSMIKSNNKKKQTSAQKNVSSNSGASQILL